MSKRQLKDNVYTGLDKKMNKDFAYLIGAYLGDGHIQYSRTGSSTSHQFSITSEDRDFCKRCSKITKEINDKPGCITKVQNYYKLVVCSKPLCNMILEHTCSKSDYYEADHISKKSHLPELSTFDIQQEFLIGLMDADGWIRETINGKYMKYEVGFKNTACWSPNIYEMMEKLGIKCSKLNYQKNGKYCKNTYSWTINPRDYAKALGFHIERKNILLKKYIESRKKNSIKRDKSVIVRFTERERKALDRKSTLLGSSVSDILREGAWSHLPDSLDSNMILKQYQQADENEKGEIVDVLFKYYRHYGYPYAELSPFQLTREMEKLCGTKNPELPDNHLQSNTVGILLANYFHPHMMKVRCLDRYMSPYDLYMNDTKFRDAIKRRLDLGQKANAAGIRRILRTRDGVRSVVNFKPAIAKFIYDRYCPENGKVLDPCAGYGGRLAGCIASNKGIQYHGIDPDGNSATGNMKMAAFFREVREIERSFNFEFKFDLGCAEEIMPHLKDESYDVIFTSPPYFDVERYSSSPDQSYKKFDTYDKWRQGFLRQIIEHSSRLINSQGHVIINVKNYKNMKIADDVLSFASDIGLKLQKTYHMRLANSEFYRHEDVPKFHTEPIFVLVKDKQST